MFKFKVLVPSSAVSETVLPVFSSNSFIKPCSISLFSNLFALAASLAVCTADSSASSNVTLDSFLPLANIVRFNGLTAALVKNIPSPTVRTPTPILSAAPYMSPSATLAAVSFTISGRSANAIAVPKKGLNSAPIKV